MIPLPYLIVGGMVASLIAAMVSGAAQQAARERRRRSRRPIACHPSVSWRDVEDALDAGCCVTADSVPMGPAPGFLAADRPWWDRYVEPMDHEGAMACRNVGAS
jgi:hypothetical protein